MLVVLAQSMLGCTISLVEEPVKGLVWDYSPNFSVDRVRNFEVLRHMRFFSESDGSDRHVSAKSFAAIQSDIDRISLSVNEVLPRLAAWRRKAALASKTDSRSKILETEKILVQVKNTDKIIAHASCKAGTAIISTGFLSSILKDLVQEWTPIIESNTGYDGVNRTDAAFDGSGRIYSINELLLAVEKSLSRIESSRNWVKSYTFPNKVGYVDSLPDRIVFATSMIQKEYISAISFTLGHELSHVLIDQCSVDRDENRADAVGTIAAFFKIIDDCDLPLYFLDSAYPNLFETRDFKYTRELPNILGFAFGRGGVTAALNFVADIEKELSYETRSRIRKQETEILSLYNNYVLGWQILSTKQFGERYIVAEEAAIFPFRYKHYQDLRTERASIFYKLIQAPGFGVQDEKLCPFIYPRHFLIDQAGPSAIEILEKHDRPLY